jgi:serine O-acetyltransferase
MADAADRSNGVGRAGADGRGEGAAFGVDPALVDELCRSIMADPRTRHLEGAHLPAREAVAELLDLVREIVFPGFFSRRDFTETDLPLQIGELVARTQILAAEQIRAVLRYAQEAAPTGDRGRGLSACADHGDCDRAAREMAAAFVAKLPGVRRMLSLDVRAAFDGDPAAQHTDETIFCYPGVEAIFVHRVAHELYLMGVPLLPRLMQERAHSRTGIDIHPGARIGESFFIDHGGGVVIGETTDIGRNVRVYQGVTLGAKSFELDADNRVLRTGVKRHPTIGDRVIIYAGAVILGGDTLIDDDCVIGGSVSVTRSIPAGHMVVQRAPEQVVRSKAGFGGEGGVHAGG